MAQKHSVACPSCGASLQVTKESLIGKRVPCPSCKTPFVIQVPTGGYIPLADDGPLSKSSTGKSSTEKSSVQKSGQVKLAAADLDDIPLLADEPSSHSRGRSSNLDAPAKSVSKRGDSKSDTAIRDSRKGGSGENIRPRSDSKTVKFTSQAESTEFDAMLADSSGTELFDDDNSKPQPPKRSKPGKESEADVETSEFDSMLADTDEQHEQVGGQLTPLRRDKPRTKADADDAESIATVEIDVDDADDDLPPAPGRSRSRGGWAVPERGPLIVWTCVGAGVLILLLIYVLFSTRGSSVPDAAASPPSVIDTEPKTSEVAESEKGTSDKSDATEGDSTATPAGTPSLLRHKEKESPKKPLNGKATPAAKPGTQKSEESQATDPKPVGQGKPEPSGAQSEAAESRVGTIARKSGKSIGKSPFDP